jgi:fructokinase
MGGDGAVINYKGEFLRHSGYLVTVEDTVGSGDSFLAAMLYKELSGASPQEALTFASALGALVASKAGGCPSYEKSEIVGIIGKQGTGIVPV